MPDITNALPYFAEALRGQTLPQMPSPKQVRENIEQAELVMNPELRQAYQEMNILTKASQAMDKTGNADIGNNMMSRFYDAWSTPEEERVKLTYTPGSGGKKTEYTYDSSKFKLVTTDPIAQERLGKQLSALGPNATPEQVRQTIEPYWQTGTVKTFEEKKKEDKKWIGVNGTMASITGSPDVTKQFTDNWAKLIQKYPNANNPKNLMALANMSSGVSLDWGEIQSKVGGTPEEPQYLNRDVLGRYVPTGVSAPSRPLVEITGEEETQKKAAAREDVILKDARDARKYLRHLRSAQEMVPRADTGWGADTLLGLAKILKRLPFFKDLDWTSETAVKEAFKAGSRSSVTYITQYYPGNLSETEVDLCKERVESIGMTGPGNMLNLELMSLEQEYIATEGDARHELYKKHPEYTPMEREIAAQEEVNKLMAPKLDAAAARIHMFSTPGLINEDLINFKFLGCTRTKKGVLVYKVLDKRTGRASKPIPVVK